MRVLQVWSTLLKNVRISCRPCLDREADSSDGIDSLRVGDKSMVNFWSEVGLDVAAVLWIPLRGYVALKAAASSGLD